MQFAPSTRVQSETESASATDVVRAPYTALDFIADQLRASAPNGDWNSNGIDRARELGAILLRNGIIDLSKLGAVRLDVVRREYPWSDPVTETQIALTYKDRTFGYLGTPTEPRADPWLENYVRVAWSAEGHGHIDYLCQFSPQGFAIVPIWGSSSDWGEFRMVLRFFITVYLMYLSAGTASGAGGTVGGAIMGASFAASYPALTAIIGNVAIGAYFSGGDVKGSVKAALIAQIAGGIGDIAGSLTYTATQIEILARLADVAVTALASGRDVEAAVKMALLREGFASFDEFANSSGVESMDVNTQDYPVTGDAYAPDAVDPYGAGSGWGNDVLPVGVDSGSGGDFTSPGFVPFTIGGTLDPVTFDPGAPAAGFQVPTIAGGERVSQPIRTTDTGPATNIVNSLSSLAMNALKLNQAWNQARNPQPVTQARRVTPGAVVSGNDGGVIITRRADGSISSERPPVGVPQATASGNYIVNNGDGTYTLYAPDGTSRRVAYGQNSGPEQSSLPWPLMLAGLGLLVSIVK